MVNTGMIVRIFVLIMLAIMIGCGFYYWLRPPEAVVQVRKTLEKLCEDASKPKSGSAASLVLKSQRLPDLFVDPCQLDLLGIRGELTGKFSPQELASLVVRLHGAFDTYQIKASDVQITIDSPTRATIEFAGSFHGRTKQGETIEELRDLTAHLERVDDQWRFAQFSIRKVIEK